MKSRNAILWVALVAIVALAVGCNMSVENTPAYTKLNERLSALEASQKKLADNLTSLTFNIDSMSEDVAALKTQGTADPAVSAESRKAIEDVANRMAEVEKQIKTLSGSLESARSARAAAPAPERERTTASVAEDKPERHASGPRAPKPAVENAPQKPRGFYYQVKAGDTLLSIAKTNRISSSSICQANRLPMSAPLYAGQKLYIPGS
jgi:LysM repeat protein